MALKLCFQSLLFLLPRKPRNLKKSKASIISRFLGLMLLVLLAPILLLLPFFLAKVSIMPIHRHNEIRVDVDKISKALWDSDFKVMSLILEKQLPRLLVTCNNIKHIKGITIFAPSDENVYDFHMKHYREEINLHYQIMTSKFDKKAFELGNRQGIFQLPTCSNPSLNISVNSDGYVQRYSYITDWDIYNDGFVAVHGVDMFFRNFSGLHPVFKIKSWLPKCEQLRPS